MSGTTIKYPLNYLDSEVGSVGLIPATWEIERGKFQVQGLPRKFSERAFFLKLQSNTQRAGDIAQ